MAYLRLQNIRGQVEPMQIALWIKENASVEVKIWGLKSGTVWFLYLQQVIYDLYEFKVEVVVKIVFGRINVGTTTINSHRICLVTTSHQEFSTGTENTTTMAAAQNIGQMSNDGIDSSGRPARHHGAGVYRILWPPTPRNHPITISLYWGWIH